MKIATDIEKRPKVHGDLGLTDAGESIQYAAQAAPRGFWVLKDLGGSHDVRSQ